MLRLGELKLRFLSFVIPRFFSYDANAFAMSLQRLGIEKGDALMVHASLRPHNGFRNKPNDMIAALKDAVGDDGLLVMPSMPYADSSRDYLLRGKPLDILRSPSHMGLLSEIFRRGKQTVRSMSPTHPLLAWGVGAESFIAGHEFQQYAFGAESPFARLLELNGKILCIDTTFESITFTHFVEDRIKNKLSFDLYDDEAISGQVISVNGDMITTKVKVLSDCSRRKRREDKLVARLKREGLLHQRRLGNTRLLLVECRALVECVDAMYQSGDSFFDD